MSRTADYTIKGFLYQFNLTLLKILESEDNAELMVEGIIEDIDIKSQDKFNAIQCKYHETKGTYTLSDIYKPILQMMVHYSKNKELDIKYTLYAYFSEEVSRTITLSTDELKSIFETNNKDYITKYISKIIPPNNSGILTMIQKNSNKTEEKEEITNYYKENLSDLEYSIDIDEFAKRFELVLGDSFSEICNKSKGKLREIELSREDVDDLFYPNCIQEIADLSIIHNEYDRIVKKVDFIRKIKSKKMTAITRWTLELQSYKEFMKKRRGQINSKLKDNGRVVNFILDAEAIEEFDNDLINFIEDYNSKYNHKIELHKTPMFCLDGLENRQIEIHDLEERLYKRNIPYENGKRGRSFFKDAFLREPRKQSVNRGEKWREFSIRFSEYNEFVEESINTSKPNILFIVGNKEYKNLDIQDVHVEKLTVRNLNELKYLLKISEELD